ncbi:N-acetylglucosaminyldiphosphodolichol N-acetylglucosaminyltransferase catalytic subunit ALG13 [Mycosarcoma maydis]|uniref:UDP-N-acetylglucosamine transferase subunit ALG13 n=1 Tax=Mycosarcoma maydis TaxID=5270 RepID=A0A0D1CXL2_MYCMD|nr:N-acetylglucosaminyldiphosphodolichol N-acetylglucosaminyltransferase catalytic subunit ALG13 [Ustilago maydis 521]KIS71068.1 hypothetical protein UMAG_00980 [Ustilago maydis 521]|eukprot:XP_011386966.1 hypothetical protein UMAG_00980 [Ustilago maydis 521]
MAAVDDIPRHTIATRGDRLCIFVTVGTTRFDSLIRAVLSHAFLDAIAELVPQSPSRRAAQAQVIVQYGNSPIADILTSSALATVDEGSGIVPEPGIRIVNGRRVYQNSPNIAGLDPGKTGTISGLRLRTTPQDTNRSHPDMVQDARSAGTSIFQSMLNEAKAMQGLGSKVTDSALQGATLQAETERGIELQLFAFAPDLKSYIQSADLVISHAGSGTILDTLRMRPRPPGLVVVPNTSLMDNHQVELAEALGKDNFLIAGSEATLPNDVVRACDTTCDAFPEFDASRFATIVDETVDC